MRFPRSQAFFILFVCLSLGFSLVIPFFDRRWSASAGFGLINDAVTDSYEYDTTEGLYPDMLRLGTSNYYAIVDSGPGNDGWLQTIKVWNNNGTIQKSLVSSLEYDTSDGDYPSIYHVSGDIYAIVYKDAAKLTLVTVRIWETNGTIKSPVLDTAVLTYGGKYTDLIRVTGNIYVVGFSEWNALGETKDGWMETRYINPITGDIGNTANDTQEFDAADAYYPKMVMIDADTVAIAYQGTGDDGFLSTWNITSAGIITSTWASQWEFDANYGGTPNIYHISGDVHAIAYRDSVTDGWVKTCSISSTGAITKVWIDTLEFDGTDCLYPSIFPVSDNVYGITYQNTSSDGAVVTLTIETDGIIGNSIIDTMEFATADDQWYAPVIWVSGFYYVLVYAGTDTGGGVVYDGWVATFQIYTNNRLWTSEASGWNTFGNTSVSWETIGQGWNLFGNTPAWSGPSGWNTFSNYSSQTMIDQGWNTFGSTSGWVTTRLGWNIFGNLSSWSNKGDGWNTFSSSPSWTGHSGWNTFSNLSSFILIKDGWNTFENTTVSWQTIDQGWNTFGNIPSWAGPSGWNIFGNAPSWTGPSGWNTFGNLSSCVTTQLGWNTFENISSWDSIDQGWNTFKNADWESTHDGWNLFMNISAWSDIEQGYNVFDNSPSWQTQTSGWNVFSNSNSWSTTLSGWNMFTNISSWKPDCGCPIEESIVLSYGGDLDFLGGANVTYQDVHDNGTSNLSYIDGDYLAIGQARDDVSFPPDWFYNIFRAFLFFNLSSIPSDAVIDSAHLYCHQFLLNTAVDFTVVVQHNDTIYPHQPLQDTDYNYTYYTGDGGTWNTSLCPGHGKVFDIILNDTGISWLTPGSWSNLTLRSDQDIISDPPAPGLTEEGLSIYTNIGGGYRNIRLNITYHRDYPGWCGWNTFSNQNWTAIIDWYPKQGDVVDPIGFQFMANISDTNGTAMNLTWEYWNGSAWVNIGNQTGLSNGTYYQDPSPWLGLLYNHTYHYRVTVVGTQTMTKDVVFTTPSGAFVITDQMVSCSILLTIFGTFLPMGYIMRRKSAGMYLMMAGFVFLSLMFFFPASISVFFMMVVFAGYIIVIGVKKTFFSKL